MILKVDFIQRRLSGAPVRARFQLALAPGALAFLAGPPGSGKSTVLYAIQGELHPRVGRVIFGDQIWFYGDGRTLLEIPERAVGLVKAGQAFRTGETVKQHLAAALSHWPTRSRGLRLTELLSTLGLSSKASTQATALPLGEGWRLALGRAIASRPALLLLDEPFQSLADQAKASAIKELRVILLREGIPALLAMSDPEWLAQADEPVLSLQESRQRVDSRAIASPRYVSVVA